MAEDDSMARPTPHTLTICTEGVNHIMQFKNSAMATSAFNKIRTAETNAEITLVDDFGSAVFIRRSTVRSLRMEDMNEVHKANFGLKICELFAAREFQSLIDAKYAALKLVAARAPGGQLIRPQ